MKQLFIMATAAVLLLPCALPAQERSASVPAELQESWTRFTEVWARGDFAGVAARFTADFALRAPAGSYQGHSALQADWPRVRAHVGSRYLPGHFVTDGERILETGRAQLVSLSAAAAAAEEEPMCDPDDGYQLQPTSYLREWVRSADGAWRVKSLVLH
jgi:hypothetical protein